MIVFRKCTIILVLVAVSLSAMAQNLVLTIGPPTNTIHVGDYPQFTVTIVNQTTNSVTLVEPGDGSDSKWRTPFVGWSVLGPDDKEAQHPKDPPVETRDCGNINPIKLSEIFTLRPSERRRLSWVGYPQFREPGRHHLVFYYQNIPNLNVHGILMGPNENGTIEAMHNSTPCRLVSNEIVVDILK